ncbi:MULTISPECIES: sensor histidine kinase [Chryseobacterium]|uniref:histidine kinase n=1 Tax=Chryseobacterium salivictor TaxID=2547600 RepID=A0A4P6ZHU5_9FLAO|nr:MULTISPECIES: ATP-binding protein [Chryseobacterium]MDQ0475803.1 signal transduction histidine kinase [Chryseobacterium sp. MDT2-18]QBO59232.1 Oxygen sensor histidine kinase NreB [Chryseobacterium salivictor]
MNLTETDFLLTITTFIILIVILMMVLVYGIFIKKKSELLLSQQRKEALFEQELAISQVEIKEQTLNYIGQELHDDLGQKLSVARLMTNKLARADEEEKTNIAHEINLLIGECIQDIRNLSKVFISKQVRHFGFVESLEREISRIERLDLLEVEYVINNHELEINSDHALILFRIIQESINNVIKHARSNKVLIKVDDHPNFTEININDYGVGFNAEHRNDGSGLENIKNRAKLIDATFKINSTENLGTEITITYKKPTPWKE